MSEYLKCAVVVDDQLMLRFSSHRVQAVKLGYGDSPERIYSNLTLLANNILRDINVPPVSKSSNSPGK